MNYGWNNLQPNQPPSGFPPPSGPTYPVGSMGPTPGFGIPNTGPEVNWGTPAATCDRGQMPFVGYGGSQIQFTGSTDGSSDIGFGSLFNNAPPAQPPQPHQPSTPSAPPMSTYGDDARQPTEFGRPPNEYANMNQIINADQSSQSSEARCSRNFILMPPGDQDGRPAGANSQNIRSASPLLSNRRDRSPHSLPPQRRPSPSPATVSSPSDGCNSETDSRRNTSRYQEGLKNMADLMTDVDINDDVLNSLKDKFDLRN